MPLFFLSCEGEDADDELLGFYAELRDAVAGRAGLSKEAAGFIYLDAQTVGKDWQASEGRALAECQVFVPIYTPRFIKSHNCGREYFAFMERLKESGVGWDRIVPLWWIPVSEGMPPVIKDVVDSRNLVTVVDHRQHGLQLVYRKRGDSNSPYPDLMSTLAEMIVERSRAEPALKPASVTDLVGRPSIFDQPGGHPQPPVERGGPTRVHFLMVAGTSSEMQGVAERTSLEYYGDERSSWSPFHADVSDPLAFEVMQIALNNRMIPNVGNTADYCISYILEKERDRELVVIIADSWAPHIQPLATFLAQYDQHKFRNTAVIVPFPEDDTETVAILADLRDRLFECIRGTMQGDPAAYRDDPGTLEQLREVVEVVLHELRSRMIMKAAPARQPFSGKRPKMPVLAAPRSLR